MTVFKVAYMPGFSVEVREELRDAFEPSMVNPSDYGAQFDMPKVESAVSVAGNSRDKEILKELKDKDVDYVEVM